MNLFWQWNRAPIVAVTGSNGKSTTTALTHSILSRTGRRCWLGGNIGRSLAKRLSQLLSDGPTVHIVQSDAVQGGALVSARGGDYELTVGQDLSIGYTYHTKHEVELYLTESFTFRVLEPAAAVRIVAPASAKP